MAQPAAGPYRPAFGRRAAAVALAALAAVGGGCTSPQSFQSEAKRFIYTTYEDPLAEQRMAEAEKLAQAGEYDAARKEFKQLADNKTNAAALAERARFMQAECRRMQRQYPQAVDTYNRLLQDFPTGTYRQQSCARMFEIADLWLDDFRGELEARKDENGVIVKASHWPNVTDSTKPTFATEDRALEALEHVHTHDITGPTADQALFWCGYVNYIRGNFNEADHFFSQLAQLHKDSKYRPMATALAIQAKNNSTGGAVYDGRKCAEALRLVHQAKATMPEMTQDSAMSAKLAKAELAIRAQQAEKLLKTAEYYERTKHPGSAYFYYEMLRRQHAGTRYSDLATARMDALKQELDKKRSERDGKTGTWDSLRGSWNDLFGIGQPIVDAPAAIAGPTPTGPSGPNGPGGPPQPSVPQALPPGMVPRP